jgi:hypothetical protein
MSVLCPFCVRAVLAVSAWHRPLSGGDGLGGCRAGLLAAWPTSMVGSPSRSRGARQTLTRVSKLKGLHGGIGDVVAELNQDLC